MHLYSQSKKRFDPETGEPLPPQMGIDRKKAICDYTGDEIDLWNNHEELPLYNVSIRYEHGSEPMWYEDLHDLERELGVEFDYSSFAKFMESPYHFRNTEAYGTDDTSDAMMMDWATARNQIASRHMFRNCKTLGDILTVARISTLRYLLKEKKYTPEQLGLELE